MLLTGSLAYTFKKRRAQRRCSWREYGYFRSPNNTRFFINSYHCLVYWLNSYFPSAFKSSGFDEVTISWFQLHTLPNCNEIQHALKRFLCLPTYTRNQARQCSSLMYLQTFVAVLSPSQRWCAFPEAERFCTVPQTFYYEWLISDTK